MTLRLSLLSLRITVVLQAILMLVQVALAGGFLGGHYDMLALHGLVGRVLTVATLLTAVAAFFVRRLKGPAAFLPLAIVLVVALVGQIALGELHSVAAHVLLGVILACATAVLTQRVMTTPLPARATAPHAPAAGPLTQPEPVK
ncbi:hypothetical protein [Streptomyces sp. NPDC001401]|uniref:hypothetical protein n=1 Tax=Streptomyces sp. NPDC001401 TaxID=3364570 RepID=UPI0036AAE215